MRDAAGRLVGPPLALGSPCCLYHTTLFHVCPVEVFDAVVAYIDLETDSLDVLSGNIVVIGALIGGSRAAFSTVINPGSRGSQDLGAVHGIHIDELLQGPSFISKDLVDLSSMDARSDLDKSTSMRTDLN